jgi:SAM-dependent methyltransferase
VADYPRWLEKLNLGCPCGRDIPLSGGVYLCGCGRKAGAWDGAKAVIGSPIPYWGEIPQDQMRRLLEESQREGWRAAVRSLLDPVLCEYVTTPDRAAFQEILPLRPGALVLDVGAGMGGIAAELARNYRVVAQEGVAERADFIALRAAQEGLSENLAVVNGDVNSVGFGPGQFDAAIVSGVLEWVGLFDTSKGVTEVQVDFLRRLRGFLKPGGLIYVGIENRIGWAQLRGVPDHSGIPYTSLLPRFLATWICRRSRNYRSSHNATYRTYTYTHGGFLKLFARAGLRARSTHISVRGYDYPTELVPLVQEAIVTYTLEHLNQPGGLKDRLLNGLRLALAKPWFWRTFGADFVFVLEAAGA